ncbi:MAG: glycine zipper 2TM domain-containing protein [Alphaproteobacteria bacterium]|nr:glycine zipper 2TM domain-containing protein [Alphaproteobacteria bacterium]
MSKQEIGTLVGAGSGALLGSKFGKGDGKIAATIAAGIFGGYIGNKIGSYLGEQDRQKLALSTQKTFETGKTQSWSNPKTNVSATTKIVDTPTSRIAATAHKECNTVEQEIVLKDGSTKTENVTACKGANGWEVLESA